MAPRLPLFLLLVGCAPLLAQHPCEGTAAYSVCEIVFEIPAADAAKHPNPYLTVQLHAEFRSPRHRTFLMPAYWDGGARMVIRFTPTDPGAWTYRVTSNVAAFNGKQEQFTAAASTSPGFVRARNVHHFGHTENDTPHLWMGDTCYPFATLDEALVRRIAEARAAQKFNHMRGLALHESAYANADTPNPAFFQGLDARVKIFNQQGITVDLILGGDENHLANLFPDWQRRQRFIRYMAARYSAFHVTWQLAQEFEEYERGKELLKEIGTLLKQTDPYNHVRTTHTVATSGPLIQDGWMDILLYQSSDNALGAIEHQIYAMPQVNAEFGYEDSGAGKSHPHHVDQAAFRKRLWHASMNGQYPTFGNTGTYGGRKFTVDAKYLESPGAKAMTVWHDFFSKTRYWDLEPYFDVDGGRALALEGVEYIVYVEKPQGPIEILVEKHGYDVAWFNPLTGERIPQKDWKGDRFAAEPPSRDHEWVLHLSREGRKEGMLRSYKFESRRILLQEVEVAKVPYEIAQPSGDIPLGLPAPFEAKLTRETRATRSMLWLWTGEVTAGGQGYRVLGTAQKGQLTVPKKLVGQLPAVLLLRLYAMNANGKVYSLDRTYQLQ